MSQALTAEFVPARSVFAPYLGFLRNACLSMLAYRMRYYTGIFNYMAFVAVNYFIWLAAFSAQPAGTLIHGFSLPEMLTYVTIGWIARTLYHSDIDYDLNEMVKSGEVTVHLMRPVNLQWMTLSRSVGETCFRVFFLSLPVGISLSLVFSVLPPASLGAALGFLGSTVISFLILSQINFITGLSAFYLHSVNGVIRAKFFLLQLLSGLLLPIPFFPDWAQQIMNFLPFKYVSYVPLQYYLGKIDFAHDGLRILAMQLFWVVALFCLSSFLWSRARSKVEIQGG